METQIPAGGASLDLCTERDRATLRTAIKSWPRRWRGVSEAVKDRCVQQLQIAMEEVEQVEDPAVRVSARCSIAKTIAMIEGQNQKDEHLELDKVVPNAPQEHRHFVVPPPRVLGERHE